MKRIKYFDLLRIVAIVCIVYYHMLAMIILSGMGSFESFFKYSQNANINLATLGVAVFFILSGASLMYTTKDSFDVKAFYKKRLFKMLIPFYIVELVTLVERLILHTMADYSQVPIYRFIYTIFGLDEWVKLHGIETYSMGIGEWFLGCILILYALYPIFRWVLLKFPKIFFVAFTVFYLLVIYNYTNETVFMYQSILVKAYEFALGMILGYLGGKIHKALGIVGLLVFIAYMFCPVSFELNVALNITIQAVALVAGASLIEPLLQKKDFKWIGILSAYTFELYLTHHEIIYVFTPRIGGRISGPAGIITTVITEILLMCLACFLLKKATGLVNRLTTKKSPK